MQDFVFLVPCAGYGSRMNSSIPKQYLLHNNKPIIYYTLKVLSYFKMPILLVVAPDDIYIEKYAAIFSQYVNIKYIGGNTRAESVLNGLEYLSKKSSSSLSLPYNYNPWVIVHDGARPLVNIIDIQNLIDKCLEKQQGGLLAAKVVDTLKKTDENKQLTTIDRNNMYLAQTPQMFKLDILFKALQEYDNVSDEASAVEKTGINPIIVEGSRFNVKITTNEDLAWLKFLEN